MNSPSQKQPVFSILLFHQSSIVIFILLVFLQSPLAAVELALGPRVGSAGAGVEFHTSLFSQVHARMGVNLLSFHIDGEESEYDYRSQYKFNSFSLLFDWMLGKTALRASSGLYVNYNTIDFTVNPTQDYHIGAVHYKSSEIGHMQGKVDFNHFAPYIGFGWGNPLKPDRKFAFVADLGFFYQNSPRVDFTATGLVAPSADQEELIAEDLRGWKIYGILSIGLMVKL